jgi:hypothetical protein
MDEVEKVARALCERHIRRVRRFDTDPAKLETMLTASVDYAWPDFAEDAQAALAAADEARAEHVMRDLVAGIHITKDGKRIALEDFYIPAPPRAGQ